MKIFLDNKFDYPEDPGPRRSGRTTRIIDSLIQNLFTNGSIMAYDHHHTDAMTKYVFDRILNRLSLEHPNLGIVADRKFKTIMLKDVI